LAKDSTVGAIIRHGPHQVAQKSIRTGLSELITSVSKFSMVRITTLLDAILFNSIHAPQDSISVEVCFQADP
jgi:hypothetical protein